MPRASLVVIGASAGGVQALQALLRSVSHDLQAAIVIVLHRMAADKEDRLPQLLQRSTALPVRLVHHGGPVEGGHVYVTPPGVHCRVLDDTFCLNAGPRENGSRPAIDVLFRSAAEAPGRKVVGVLLSGLLDDGTAGLAAIKAAGGYTIAQDPADAMFGDMPRNAILNVEIHAVCRASEMGACIAAALEKLAIPLRSTRPGVESSKPSPFSCPDCGGVLWEQEEDGVLHFRCRVGHPYAPSTLYERQDNMLEEALWAAVRALEERAEMSEVLAKRLRTRGLAHAAQRLERQAAVARERARTVRQTVTDLVIRRESDEADQASTGS